MENKKITNYTRLINKFKQYDCYSESFAKEYGDLFMNSPSGINENNSLTYEGGLMDYIIKVISKSLLLNKCLKESEQVEERKIIRVGLLHAIGKTGLFIKNENDIDILRGNIYKYNNKLTPLKVGERSILMAMECGIKLSSDEFQAIINHDKENDEQAKYFTCNLGVILKTAIEFVNIELKK